MNVTTKEAVAQVQPVESDDPNGQFDVILSTDGLDRDGERLFADEWKTPLPERINFDSDHGMSVEKTVGSGVPTIENGQLRVRGTFASTPHAQAVRTLVKEGHITQTSVAFMQRKGQKDAKPQRELLNGSFVSVPANPEAVILSAKAKSDVENAADAAQAGDSIEDMPGMGDMVQAIHDAACHLGADCTGTKDFVHVPPDFLNSTAISRPGLATGLKTPDIEEMLKGSFFHQSSDTTVGTPQKSAVESAAADVKSAAADDSADVAQQARGLAFLINLASLDADSLKG